MNVLGFDTSTAASAACVLRHVGSAREPGDAGSAFEVVPDPETLAAPPAHARELLPAIAEVLDRSALDWADLDALAVGVGPGSFTGLRIGVATARGLARARGLELRPVSSLAALAAGSDAPLVLALIDARRGELFAALYEDGEERWPPFAARPDAVAERLRRERLAPLACGDGSVRWRRVLEAAGIRVEPDGSRAHVVRALHVCHLAAGAPPASPEAVLPEYLRLPDAKPTTQ